MSLAKVLEQAACELAEQAERIRPANGDPERLLRALPPEAAAQVLAWVLVRDPEAGEELALAWAELGPSGAAALAAVDPDRLPKPGRKALGRARHRLRSQGGALPETDRVPEPRVARLPRVTDSLPQAWVTRVDPSGAQLLMLIEASPRGGARIFQALLDDERGIIEFQVLAATRSRARERIRELSRHPELFATEVTPEQARARLMQVASVAAPPASFLEWRAHLGEGESEVPTPGESARRALAVQAEERERLVRELAERVEKGEIGPWPPPPEELRELAERIRSAARSQLVLSETQRRERIESILREELERRFGSEGGERAARRLEECAFVFWKRDRVEEARGCLAAAALFRTQRPDRNPVARALVLRVLGPMLERLRDEERASLVVKP